jgi:hypothetical protein
MGPSYADVAAEPSNYPERKPHVPDTEFIVGSLLGLLFLFGVLILLVLGAKEPPAFAQLTVFRCGSVNPLPRRYHYAGANPTTIYACRAGDLVVHQVGTPTDGLNPGAWNNCVRNGGVLRIWRHANPSPYGAFVFQSSCNGHVIMAYGTRAAQYVANRQFSLAVAWFLILGSIAGIAIQATKRH